MKKILIYNWVQFDDAEQRGGGVSVYLKNTLPIMLDRGYDVTFISAGMHYGLMNKAPHIKPTSNTLDERGVKSFQIINSPIKAPAHDTFGALDECLDNSEIVDLFVGFIEQQGGFDQVHLHNIEGISTGLVEALKNRLGTRVVVWLHNYHWLCPQIELFKDRETRCEDYHAGTDCVGCLGYAHDMNASIRGRRLSSALERANLSGTRVGNFVFSFVRNSFDMLRSTKALVFGQKGGGNDQEKMDWSERSDEATLKLTELAKKAPQYQRWRERNIELLNNSVDEIFAVSSQVKERFGALGVDADKITVAPLGMDLYRSFDDVMKIRREPSEKLTLGFFGYPIPSKGLNFLINTLEQLDAQSCEKIELYIFCWLDEGTRRRLVRVASKFRVTILEGYKRDELEDIAAKIDLCVVPSLWWETFNQVAYELTMCRVPVFASDTLGYALEYMPDEFLFESGNADSLISKLTAIINSPNMLEEYWGNLKQYPLSLEQHLDRVEAKSKTE